VRLPLSTQFDERYFASVYGDYSRQNPPRKLRFYRELLERYLPPTPAPRVLDLGCAFGLFLAGLPREFQRYGVDASHHALSAAAQRVPQAHFINADCGNPPISSRFDAIVAFDVLEHLPEAEATLDFVRRSLNPKGVFLFVVPVYDGPLGPVIRWLDRDPTHVHKRSREWWLELARQGFDVVSWTGILRYLVARRYYVHMPSPAIRGVAPAIAVVCRLRAAL
jgi:SAM-dependent methyltransferase